MLTCTYIYWNNFSIHLFLKTHKIIFILIAIQIFPTTEKLITFFFKYIYKVFTRCFYSAKTASELSIFDRPHLRSLVYLTKNTSAIKIHILFWKTWSPYHRPTILADFTGRRWPWIYGQGISCVAAGRDQEVLRICESWSFVNSDKYY